MTDDRIRTKAYVKRLTGVEVKIYDGPDTSDEHFVGDVLISKEVLGRKERYWGLVITVPEGVPIAVRDHNEDRCEQRVLRSQRGFSRICEIGIGGPKMLPCEHLVPPRGCKYDGWKEETK